MLVIFVLFPLFPVFPFSPLLLSIVLSRKFSSSVLTRLVSPLSASATQQAQQSDRGLVGGVCWDIFSSRAFSRSALRAKIAKPKS